MTTLEDLLESFDKKYGVREGHPSTKFKQGDYITPVGDDVEDDFEGTVLEVLGFAKASTDLGGLFGQNKLIKGRIAVLCRLLSPHPNSEKEKERKVCGWMFKEDLSTDVKKLTPATAKRMVALARLRK